MSKIKIADLFSKPILKDLDSQDIQCVFGGRQPDPDPDPLAPPEPYPLPLSSDLMLGTIK
jgi:hypothetical protein